MVLHALRTGLSTFRQDAWGVYHVILPNGDEPFLLPPPDFPQGHSPREQILKFIRRNRLSILDNIIAASEGESEGDRNLHLLTPLALMAGEDDSVEYSDSEIVYFLGWKD